MKDWEAFEYVCFELLSEATDTVESLNGNHSTRLQVIMNIRIQ